MFSQKQTKKNKKKYTPQEVLDSLDYRETDHDDDYDGYIHLVSDLDGSHTRIKIDDLKCVKERDRIAREEERERIKAKLIKKFAPRGIMTKTGRVKKVSVNRVLEALTPNDKDV